MSESLKVAAELTNTDVAEMMNQLSLGLMHGAVTIHRGGKRHDFHPGQVLAMEIRADEDGEKGSLEIALRWRVPLRVTTVP